MSLNFKELDFTSLEVALADTSLDVQGKRGEAKLQFDLLAENQRKIGTGVKSLILSGLREYEEGAIQSMREQYIESKRRYAG